MLKYNENVNASYKIALAELMQMSSYKKPPIKQNIKLTRMESYVSEM